MKLSRQEAAKILKQFNLWRRSDDLSEDEIEMPKPKLIGQAIDTAIEALGETKLIDETHEHSNLIIHIHKTECCKIGPITTEKFCPECGKKIIR